MVSTMVGTCAALLASFKAIGACRTFKTYSVFTKPAVGHGAVCLPQTCPPRAPAARKQPPHMGCTTFRARAPGAGLVWPVHVAQPPVAVQGVCSMPFLLHRHAPRATPSCWLCRPWQTATIRLWQRAGRPPVRAFPNPVRVDSCRPPAAKHCQASCAGFSQPCACRLLYASRCYTLPGLLCWSSSCPPCPASCPAMHLLPFLRGASASQCPVALSTACHSGWPLRPPRLHAPWRQAANGLGVGLWSLRRHPTTAALLAYP